MSIFGTSSLSLGSSASLRGRIQVATQTLGSIATLTGSTSLQGAGSSSVGGVAVLTGSAVIPPGVSSLSAGIVSSFSSSLLQLSASSPVDVETSLTDSTQLWALSRLLLMSWAKNFTIATAWFTNEVTANNGAQKRMSFSGKPGRVIRFTLLTFKRRETWLVMQMIKRMGQGRSLVPIYGDFTKSTTANSIGDTAIVCDTTYRRFFVGGLVAVASPTRTPEFANFETVTITSVTPTSLGVTALVNAYPLGSRVYPMVECDVMLNGPISVITDRQIEASFICKETEGPSALPPLLDVSVDSSPYTVQSGYPVFYSRYHWSIPMQEGYRGSARTTHSGIGDLFELIGSRPRYHSVRSIYAKTRAEAWTVALFFDFVCGSAWPFFVVSLVAPFDVHQVSVNTISVTAAGPLEDWNDLQYIALIQRSTNTPYVAQISGVTRTLNVDTITLMTLVPDLTGDLRSVNPAYLVRFESDELAEQWVTNSKALLTFSVVEVLQEGSISLTGF